MGSKLQQGAFFRLFAFLVTTVLFVITIAIGLYYYIFSIPEPEGLSLSSWPSRFTDNFSSWWMDSDGETVVVNEKGLHTLEEYGLWIQVIDESGQEVFSHSLPENYSKVYTASELIELSTKGYENGYTVFSSTYEHEHQTWSYFIGFPYAIGKYMLFFNGDNIGRLSPVFRAIIVALLGITVLGFLYYGIWLTRHLGKITSNIKRISERTYTLIEEKGMMSSIYKALNEMDKEIHHTDKLKEKTERTRREWIANITHDLKTPLSPIKGYAELLVRGSTPEKIQTYGEVILKNVNHTERLINDLKLTYQLDSGELPFDPQKIRLTRFIRECVLDIVNDPTFNNRDIIFESNVPESMVMIDTNLFRRVVQNIVINAFIHNRLDTKVVVSIESSGHNKVSIIIEDNGVGISKSEQEELFTRYYRGTNTKEKAEGSGLGLAIAKQIVTLHEGDIIVQSKVNVGTKFIITLPLNAKTIET